MQKSVLGHFPAGFAADGAGFCTVAVWYEIS